MCVYVYRTHTEKSLSYDYYNHYYTIEIIIHIIHIYTYMQCVMYMRTENSFPNLFNPKPNLDYDYHISDRFSNSVWYKDLSSAQGNDNPAFFVVCNLI